jgi:transketolase
MRNSFINALLEEARKDARIILIVGDLGYGVVDEFRSELPSQFMNFGINEQSMMSAAAGLASEGFRPFVYSIGNFPTLRCLEQIRNDVCFMNLPVTFVAVGAGFAYGTSGYSHHLIEDISILRGLPNLRLFSPVDQVDSRASVVASLEEETPAYVRIGKGGEPSLNPMREDSKLGYREYLDGPDGIILFTSTIGDEVISAGKILEERGLCPTIASCSQLNSKQMSHLVSKSQGKFIMTVEEHTIAGGFGSMVRELLQNDFTNSGIISCGVEKLLEREVGSQQYLRGIYGLDAISLSQKFEKFLAVSRA